MDKYEIFKKKIFNMTGINLSYYKERQMKRRISSLISRNNFKDFDDYLINLKNNDKLFDEFINYLTINVSDFFRNPKQWNTLEYEILPTIINKTKKIKVWSSACSTGEECYSLVMLLTKFYNLKEIQILATDIDNGAIEKAKIGVYNEKSMKNIPGNFKNKYFSKSGMFYKISDDIKKCVKFKKLNLLSDNFPIEYDLILCRNVMIYFTEEAKSKIYHKFYNSLSSNGVFFVGSTEQIITPSNYGLKPLRTFFYQKIN